jgi:hypothetical protein
MLVADAFPNEVLGGLAVGAVDVVFVAAPGLELAVDFTDFDGGGREADGFAEFGAFDAVDEQIPDVGLDFLVWPFVHLVADGEADGIGGDLSGGSGAAQSEGATGEGVGEVVEFVLGFGKGVGEGAAGFEKGLEAVF